MSLFCGPLLFIRRLVFRLHQSRASVGLQESTRWRMRLQNIFRMHAMVIGFGAVLLLASSARAQEIENTNWDEASNSVATAQPAAAPNAIELNAMRRIL